MFNPIILKTRLEKAQTEFEARQQFHSDPVVWPMKFHDPGDQEVVGLLSALLAYGNIKQIQKTQEKLFSYLGPSPKNKLLNTPIHKWGEIIPRDFKHRFTTRTEIIQVLCWLTGALKEAGSLEAFFLKSPTEAQSRDHLDHWLDDFITRFISLPSHPNRRVSPHRPFYLLPRPRDGSACKRPLLFLRWMVGSTKMDLGIWTKVPRSKLVIPLDTHVHRISRKLKLTLRKSADWKSAIEVTESLKRLDSLDPVRFDFALCHLGVTKREDNLYV